MFKDFIATKADSPNLKVGAVDWFLPPELVDAYKVEGFFRLHDERPALDVLPEPDDSYPVGSNTLCVKATEADGIVHLIVWCEEGGPYRRTKVEGESIKKKK